VVARRLPRSFFAREVLDVAPDLLGCTVERAGVVVRLTEVEAYAGHLHDPGSHAYRGRTPRTEPMFGPAGFTYVYFTYGMHWCLNLVTGPVGAASAVLLRAGEVVAGHETAAARRPGVAPRDWCRGPARLASTLGLGRADSGLDFCTPPVDPERARSDLVVRAPAVAHDRAKVRTGPRVGVGGAGGDVTAYPWRFWLDGEPTVSVYRPAKHRVRRTAR
jgi:DNA-3-methyladenine glycosylase